MGMHTLYVVGTPIGNLDDLSQRALRLLETTNVIACETPQQTRKLLSHFGIRGKKLIRYREENRTQAIAEILRALEKENVILVSDAGTPGIADPGAELVAAARESGARVLSLPGPSALVAALSLSGVRVERFVFFGFLPRREKELDAMVQLLEKENLVGVGYEAPHRIEKTLRFLAAAFPRLYLVLVKEISKIHESVFRGTTLEVFRQFETTPNLSRGEFVIVLKPEKSSK
jgi:16S rRNA (cytidine1402-2'-O)-methyltransferase